MLLGGNFNLDCVAAQCEASRELLDGLRYEVVLATCGKLKPLAIRKAWLTPLLDHATWYVLGLAVGERADSGLALDARSATEQTLPHYRDSFEGVIVH